MWNLCDRINPQKEGKMREPKQVVVSEDGLTISVGEKEFAIDNLHPAEIALIMKERCKGFLKEKRTIGKKAKVYAMAGFRTVVIGLGCWFFFKGFSECGSSCKFS